MSATTFPRLETIAVPDSIKLEFIGKYVTTAATRILTEVGIGGVVPRTARIHPISDRLYGLSFETGTGYEVPKTLDISYSNQGEHRALEEGRQMSVGLKGGYSKTSSNKSVK